MWTVTRAGFFSAVQKRGSTDLTVRARVKKDLENLIRYLPESESGYSIQVTPNADYGYRLMCSHENWASALYWMAMDVDYDNFKSEIGNTDPERESILHGVWTALYQLTGLERAPDTFWKYYKTGPKSRFRF